MASGVGEPLWLSPSDRECKAAVGQVSTWMGDRMGDRVGKMTCCRFPLTSVFLFFFLFLFFSYLMEEASGANTWKQN